MVSPTIYALAALTCKWIGQKIRESKPKKK